MVRWVGVIVVFAAVSCGGRGPVRRSATDGKVGPVEPAGFELAEVSIPELQRQMESGERTSREITELYLARIEALNRKGPELRAVIEVNPDALEIAAALDAERAASGPRGPLHGIPVLLKDNIATADATETTAGSLALVGVEPTEDAFVAKRLREAGAVLLGKANLSEWANFRSTRSSSGWSARGGQTRNPYVLDRNPCGSSSGSGVAVSANMVALAIGTETDGSVVCPSAVNGIVGIKPTIGLVSRTGIIPISASQDTAGPMARTVTDAAIALGAMVGADPADPATAGSEGNRHPDYTAFLDDGALEGARIGVSRAASGKHPDVDAVMERAIAAMRDRGAVIVDPVEVIAKPQELDDAELEVLLYEFKAGMADYLAPLPGDGPRTLADLIAFNDQHADAELRYFGQEIFVMADKKGGLDDPAYETARATAKRLAGAEGIDRVMAEHDLDAIVAPTTSPAWSTDLVNGDHYLFGTSTPAAVAGYPNISVPAGFVHGLPVGISFYGRAWSEPRLIAIAYAFEQATKARRPPELLPTLPARE